MKTPIKYWGGKQQLADRIISLMPPHSCYTKVFFGGGAVFFQKPISTVEIINDISDNMVNFYKTIKCEFEALHNEVDTTLYSEYQYREAKAIWDAGMGKSELRAWAVFVLSHQSFSGNLGQGWAHSDTKNLAKKFDKEKKMFDERYVKRLDKCRYSAEMRLTYWTFATAKILFTLLTHLTSMRIWGIMMDIAKAILKTF